MKYLKNIVLENFQSHKHTSMNFDEGLNVILGPSDSGKSAIIRAIKWALYNEPSGDYFIREGEREASVTLTFSDNTKIQRKRSKSKNIYILYKKNGEEIKYEGFGTTVPEEIVEEIGIKKIRLDSEESNAINLGEQLEGPFLLSEKSSTRAGAIGRLIGVNIIDDALKETLRDIRNTSSVQKNTEEQVFKFEEELKEYEYLDELEERIKKTEKIKTKLFNVTTKKNLLISISNKYNEIDKELISIENILIRFDNFEKLNPLINEVEKKNSTLKTLNQKREYLNTCQNYIENCKTDINKLKHVNMVSMEFENIIKAYNKVIKLNYTRTKLNLLLKDKNSTIVICNKLSKIINAEDINNLLEKKQIKLVKLLNLNNQYIQSQRLLNTGNEFVDRFDKLNTSEALYKEIIFKFNILLKLSNLSKEINSLKNTSTLEKKQYDMLVDETNKTIYKYKELLSKIEVCPFCLSDIDSNKIEHIISHYE